MKLFSRGYQFEFNSHPTYKKIKDWVIKKTGPVTKEITSDAQFEKIQKKKFAIAFFGPEDEIYEEFLKIAVVFENVAFYHSHDEKYLRLNNMNTLTIFKDYDGGKVDYHGILSMEKMEEFILKHM